MLLKKGSYLCRVLRIESFIARQVALSGRRTFSRRIIRIAIVAVAISVAVMICATAMVSGFKTEIRNKIFGFWGHVHISDADINRSMMEAYPISKSQDFYPSLENIGQVPYIQHHESLIGDWSVEKLTHGGVRHIQVYAIFPGIIQAGDEIEGIILKGVGKDFDWDFMQQYIQEGSPLTMKDTTASRDILISRQTAKRLRLEVGEKLIVNFVENGEALKRRYTVSGIYKTGLEEFDQKFALIDIRQIQQLLHWEEDQVSGFEVFLDDVRDLVPLTDYIYIEHMPTDLFAETVREKLPEIFNWLDLQDINEVVILVLMLLVAIINMTTALLILILERTNMIGILKSLGTGNWSIQKIFLLWAGYIVVVGLFWGNLLGIGLCLAQKYFGFIRLSEENYYLSVAPVHLHTPTILIINLGTLLLTILFLIIPSYLISRVDPVKALRFK